MLRSALAILAGFVLFAGAMAVFFNLMGRDPHARASMPFMLLTTFYGMLFAALGGYLTVLLSTRHKFEHAFLVALMIAASGAALILGRPQGTPVWSHLAEVLTMAPIAMVGGYLRLRQLHASRTK